jgi:7,8-dihydro-6-hydroxymethylpterin dimethyltransferase
MKKLDKTFGATGKNYGKVGKDRTMDDIEKRRRDRWNFLFIAGMWFQDLFNYDFRRTEQCIIPYATQEGEISFCAYNTGVGWRNIIEKMHMTATLTKWYEENGRHEIFAGGKSVPLKSREHSLVLREEIVTNEIQHDLDRLGIAKNARRREDPRARRQDQAAGRNERMMKLYREHVLKEQPSRMYCRVSSMILGLSSFPGRLCPAITARGFNDSTLSRASIHSRRFCVSVSDSN